MRTNNIIVLLALLAVTTPVLAATSVDIAPWYPKGNEYIFICNSDFEATHYNWYFGDGEKLIHVEEQSVFHRYADDGEFRVSCTAKAFGANEGGSISVEVGEDTTVTPGATVQIKDGWPKGQDYIFICDTDIPTTSYDWYFGDGDKLLGVENRDVYHSYTQPGSYQVSCSATNYSRSEEASTPIVVGDGTPNQPPTNSFLFETFSDNDYTNNPTWEIQTTEIGTVTYDASTGAAHIVRANAGGAGRSSWLVIPLSIPVTDDTAASFDIKVTSKSLGGAGSYGTEFPVNVGFTVRRADGGLWQVWYAYNYDGGSDSSDGETLYSYDNVTIIATGDAPVDAWLRGEMHTIRDAIPDAQEIVAARIGGVGWDFNGWYDNIRVFEPTPELPEWGSTLFLTSGVVNGQTVSDSQRTVTVNPGEAISGSIDFDVHSTYGSNAVMVFAGTSTWGENSASCVDHGFISTPGDYSKTVPVTFTAPNEPGEYYLIYQYRGEFNAPQVCSLTNWGTGDGSAQWDDGNDMADWSADMIASANDNGRVLAQLEYNDGFKPFYVPAQAIKIIVEEQDTQPSPTCLLDASATVSSGWIEYDRTVGEERHFVWIQEPMRIHWLEATRDGELSLTRSWYNGNWNATHPEASFCIGGNCVTPATRSTTVESTCAQAPEPSLEIRLYPGFPVDYKAAFECVANGFTPEEYNWDFGDGQTQTTSDYDAFVVYTTLGTHEVSCSAEHNGVTYTDSLSVTADAPISPSLITGENQHVNSTLTVGGNSGPMWGTYLQLVEQNGNDFTLHCGEIGHRTAYPTSWQIPPGVEVMSTSADTETKVLRAAGPGSYEFWCSQGVRDTKIIPDFYSESETNVLYHNSLPAFGYGPDKAITGYGVSLSVSVDDATACYPGLSNLTVACDLGSVGGYQNAPVTSDSINGNCRVITCGGGGTTSQFTACEQVDGDQYSYVVNATSWSGGYGMRGCFDNTCFTITGSRCDGSRCWVNGEIQTSPEMALCMEGVGGSEQADLHGRAIRTFISSLPYGEQIPELNAHIENIGTAPVDSPFFNEYYLSSDDVLDESDYLIASGEHTEYLYENGGDTQHKFSSLPPPQVSPGTYKLLGAIDTNNSINESNESNNKFIGDTLVIAERPFCYEPVRMLEADCDGTITQDTFTGCRQITCEKDGQTMQVQACDHESAEQSYFDMLRSGARLDFCLGDTCFQPAETNNDYARSDDASCEEPPVDDPSATLSVLEELSADHNQVFSCDTTFDATHYTWYVDDTEVFAKDLETYGPNTATFEQYFHTFPNEGTYSVRCEASDDEGNTADDELELVVTTPATPEEIAESPFVVWADFEYLGDNQAQVTCESAGIAQASPWMWVTRGRWDNAYPETLVDFRNYDGSFYLAAQGDYEVRCAVGTVSEDAWREGINQGSFKGYSCFGGPRDGDPQCNVGGETITGTVPEDAPPILVTPIAGQENNYTVTCNGPNDYYIRVTVDDADVGSISSWEGTDHNSINATITQDPTNIVCYSPNPYTYFGQHTEWVYNRTIDLP
jgi:hypothetical protein